MDWHSFLGHDVVAEKVSFAEQRFTEAALKLEEIGRNFEYERIPSKYEILKALQEAGKEMKDGEAYMSHLQNEILGHVELPKVLPRMEEVACSLVSCNVIARLMQRVATASDEKLDAVLYFCKAILRRVGLWASTTAVAALWVSIMKAKIGLQHNLSAGESWKLVVLPSSMSYLEEPWPLRRLKELNPYEKEHLKETGEKVSQILGDLFFEGNYEATAFMCNVYMQMCDICDLLK